MFNIGDVVIVSPECDVFENYAKATIIGCDKDVDYCYIRPFDTNNEFLYSLSSLSEDRYLICDELLKKNGWSVNDCAYCCAERKNLIKFDESTKFVKCCICGISTPLIKAITTKGKKVICSNCISVKDYSTENDKCVKRKTKAGWTFGFEFECVPKSKAKYGDLLTKYGFIPTRDGSLPAGGIEFKSPIINGRSSLRKMFKYAENRVDFSNYYCGQHINIGNSEWMDENSISIISKYSKELFKYLLVYMASHENDARKVCGRCFNRYCKPNLKFEHGSWINLQHENRIEFRISKFVNSEQYFNLVNMWVEMLDMIHKQFIKNINTTDSDDINSKKAVSVGKNIVDIFKKYT